MNKKGKEFYKFKTNLTEKINWFKVYDLQVWLCSDFTFNHYVDSKDKNFFLCNDKINDMLVCKTLICVTLFCCTGIRMFMVTIIR